MNPDLEQIVEKTHGALAGYWGVLSTGEKLATALVLNRPDWLSDAGYTIADALRRIGPEWASLIPVAAELVARQLDREREAAAKSARDSRVLQFEQLVVDDEPLYLAGTVITHSYAPGYRHVHLEFDLCPLGSRRLIRADVKIRHQDAETIVRSILRIHRFAWRIGKPDGPIDRMPGEERPSWIDRPLEFLDNYDQIERRA